MATILTTPCVPENFPYLANRILNYTLLMINGKPHRICEIEFYLNSPSHPDSYVHGHVDQTKNGTWYFHRHGNGTYKNGTFRSMDLVLGSGNTYAAVLFRSIIDIEQKKMISGPCLLVNHILALTGVDSILTLTNNTSLNVLQNDRGLILVEGNATNPDPISYGPRIGLSAKYPEYKDKKYRFTIGNIKKDKKTLIPLV